MANTISTAFIKQFESEVHLAYQRMGSKLRNTVRTVSNVSGNVVRFQKIGTGSASTKSRNGLVTPMELAHTTVEATMSDFYASEYIDKLDELKQTLTKDKLLQKVQLLLLVVKQMKYCILLWMLVLIAHRFMILVVH